MSSTSSANSFEWWSKILWVWDGRIFSHNYQAQQFLCILLKINFLWKKSKRQLLPLVFQLLHELQPKIYKARKKAEKVEKNRKLEIEGNYASIRNPILTLARKRLFTASNLWGGGSVGPPAARPLMILELREKNECVARNERKPMVSNFMTLGQPVTSDARSNTQI